MKSRSLILLLFFPILLQGNANAQFGGALKKAINKSISNKIDSSESKKSKENPDNNSSAQNGGTKETGRGLLGGKIDIKYDDEYKFTGRIYMQMEVYEKKEVLKSDYYTYFNPNTMDAGVEVKPQEVKDQSKNKPTTFIFDSKNRCFLMMVSDENSKTGVISTIPSDSSIKDMANSQKGSNPGKPTITKTGNSRMIAGYKCDEYKIVDAEKEGYTNVWMTKEVKIKADNKYWSKAGVPTYYNYPGFEGAMMLAMESFDKDNNPVMKMETKEINENFSNSISTVGYTFMKMNFGAAGKK